MTSRRNRVLRWTAGIGVVLTVIGAASVDSAFGLRALLLGIALLAITSYVLWRRWLDPAGFVRRSWGRSRRHHGMASRWQILRRASRCAVRRRMRTLRPSYDELSIWQRLRAPTTDFAYRLAKVGWFTLWATCEDAKIAFGGPRTGKSGELACRIIEAPGAVIATSTRTDLVTLTAELRARIGPVFVFNPSGVGGLASTVTFDPLTGCDDPKTAVTRATDLIAGATPGASSGRASSDGDREHWAGQARDVLAVLMHAAARGGRSMRDVHAWVSDPDRHYDDIRQLLRSSPEPGFEAELVHFVTTNDRTRSSITQSIRPTLMWLHDPTAARAAGQMVRAPVIDASGVTVPDDDPPPALDVEALLALRGTVYLLGAEDAQVAPLVAALTGHIARVAREVAGRQPSGRLDPPLTLNLDEAAIICPIPLDKWSSDMGGRGVTIHIAAQSRPQLRQRWGQDGAAAILNNAAALVIYGGTRDAEDLQAYSTLAGEREERVQTRDHTGRVMSETPQRVPVFTPAQIAQLPRGRVLLISRDMAPVIGKVEMAWQRRDVRTLFRARRRAARAEKRAAVWRHRREVLRHYSTEFKAAIAELAEEFLQAVQEWNEQRQQAIRRREEQRARQIEVERVRHEQIDPQPAGGEHDPDPEHDQDVPESSEPDDD
jgi:type IV secretory pathway TraG/TraD family ATPase VirD4